MGVPDMRLRKTARDAVVETLNLASGHPRVMAHVMDRVRFPEYLVIITPLINHPLPLNG